MKSIILISAFSLTFFSCMSSRSAEGSQVQVKSVGSASSGSASTSTQISSQLMTEKAFQENTSTEVIRPGGDSARSINFLKETK